MPFDFAQGERLFLGTTGRNEHMIDNLSLLLSHGLILIACWRLLSRPDMDEERPVDPRSFFARRPPEERRDA